MSEADKRLLDRQPVLKSAKIHVAHSVIDCLVLDLSPTGLRVGTEGLVVFPDTVVVEFRNGGMWHAVRRWQRGVETGFELVRFHGLTAEAAQRAATLRDAALSSGIPDLLARLGHEGHFGDPRLTLAAEALEKAHAGVRDAFEALMPRP